MIRIGAQRLILINERPNVGHGKNHIHEDLFLEIIPNMMCVEGNTQTKSCPKTFRANIFRTHKNLPAPTPM